MIDEPFTGKWLRDKLKLYFPLKKDKELAEMIGVSPQAYSNWGSKDNKKHLPNAETLFRAYSLMGMLHIDPSTAPFRNSRDEWPVRGRAGADSSNGTRSFDTDHMDDVVAGPSELTLVPIVGDSMSPLILSGQYAMVNRERQGFETNGGVVIVDIRDEDMVERQGKMTGVFVKRCFKRDGFYHFVSINSIYSPFNARQEYCKIWPVIGVWFGDKGVPPESRLY